MEEKTVKVYISKDGIQFMSMTECINHEAVINKAEYKLKVLNMDLEELNNEIIKYFGEQGKHYTTNIEDAFELYSYELFNGYGLYKDDEDVWGMEHISYEPVGHEITGYTVPEVLSRFALLKYHDLIDY
jgi:hypothetical protein